MPNEYVYDLTFKDKHDEEDREVKNDMMRAIGKYYTTIDKINRHILYAIENLSDEELKEMVMNKSIVESVVTRID